IPGSLPVNGTLVPMPFTALVVSANHFDDGRWLSELSALLKVIPDLGLQHYNFSINVGRSHGERPVPGVSPRHPFGWVIYGRDKFIEASTPTSGIGLATVVYQARVTAGSMPTEEVLLAIWEALPDDPNRLADYHDELYQMAASNRAIK
ncbi:MAG TPA: hypothetical protein VM581_03105, partial [Magnetospirillaceae bacterium]|nr:hypothetical protein [Magnetospirillaceae bacterium]